MTDRWPHAIGYGWVIAGLLSASAAVAQTTTGNVDWKGEGVTAHWNVTNNWEDDLAPVIETPGTVNFAAAAHLATSIVETARSVRGVEAGASGATVTHTIDLGGNTLTVTNLLRAGRWAQAPVATLFLTNGTVRLGTPDSAATMSSQRGLLSFNRAGTWLETVWLDAIQLIDGSFAGATLDLCNVQCVGGHLTTRLIEVGGRNSSILLNGSLSGSTVRVTQTLSLLPLLGTSYIGNPDDPVSLGGANVGRFPAAVEIALGTDTGNRANAHIGRASPHAVVRCALAVAPGGGAGFTAYLEDLHIGYSSGNAQPTYGLLDAAAMDACLLDVLNLQIGTDRPSPNPVDNFNGTLALPPGTATVANAVIGGFTAGTGTLSISNTLFAVTNQLTLNPGARLRIATDAASRGLHGPGGSAIADDGVEIAVTFMEQSPARTTNWAVRIAGDVSRELNSMIGTGRLTWELAAGITNRKAGVLVDDTDTYFAMVDADVLFPPVALAWDVTVEIMLGVPVFVDAGEIDNGSFDPDGRPMRIRVVFDGGPECEWLEFDAVGVYPVTLVASVLDGEGAVIDTATDHATVHVVLPAPTAADIEWTGVADTMLNTGRREWYWSGNWVGNATPANPTLGTVFLRTLGQDLTGVVETDRTVNQVDVGVSGAAVTHTVNLGGHTLTVTDFVRAGQWGQSPVTTLFYTNGTLRMGMEGSPAMLSALRGLISFNREGTRIESANLANIRLLDGGWGGATLDLRGVQLVGDLLKTAQIEITGRGSIIQVNHSLAGGNLHVTDSLQLLPLLGTAYIGDPDNSFSLGGGNVGQFPAGVSLRFGVDPDQRCTADIGRASPHAVVRCAIAVEPDDPAGADVVAYLSTLRLGYSEGNAQATYGVLDLAALETCRFDVQNLYMGTDRPSPQPTDNFNGILRLPPGTATIGNATVGGTGVGQAVFETSNTVVTVTGTLTLNKTARVTHRIGETAGGLRLLDDDPTALTIDSDATLTLTFETLPAAGQPHYGLRWAGDHVTTLQMMVADGRLIVDDAGLAPKSAMIFVTAGDTYGPAGHTYVGLPPPRGMMVSVR